MFEKRLTVLKQLKYFHCADAQNSQKLLMFSTASAKVSDG